MHDWWPTIASICIGVPISVGCRWGGLLAGMFCMGINIVITLLMK